MLTASDSFKPRTKEDYAYEVLRAAILRCELKPGDRLVLDSLGAHLGISSIPMRAALLRLQSEGFVDITPHIGAVVSDLNPASIEHVSVILERLELLGFELAMLRVTPEDIAKLRCLVREMGELLASGNTDRWSEMNGSYHRCIAAFSDNKLLVEFTGRALDDWTRLRRWYLPEVVQQLGQAQAEHAQMVELLAQRDLVGLANVLTMHHRRIRNMYHRAVAELTASELRKAPGRSAG
jgi:DNA-binding GntR family transcriptional regulator